MGVFNPIPGLALTGCAITSSPSQWERLARIDERVTIELDRNSLTRRGEAATVLARTAYLEESKAGRPRAPCLSFGQRCEFSCYGRTFILLVSRTHIAATGKWRDWPGIDEPREIDLGTRPNCIRQV